MTLQEFSDKFDIMQRIQAPLHRSQFVQYPEKIKAQWISEAQNKLAAKIGMLQTSIPITVVNGQTLYDLPSDFKRVVLVSIPSLSVPLYTPSDLTHVTKQQSIGCDDFTYAIIWDKTNTCWAIQFVQTPSDNPTIQYALLPGVYSPSAGAVQEWGTFDGMVYAGNCLVGDEYASAITYYMLGEIFPDLRVRFMQEVNDLIQNKISVSATPFTYKFGGKE
jgi:hypothetical protein